MIHSRRVCAWVAVLLASFGACGDGENSGVGRSRGGGDLTAMRERGTIRLLAPRLYAQEEIGESGFRTRLEREAAEFAVTELGLTPVWVHVDRYEDLIPALLEGRGDVIVARLTATRRRAERVAFSVPLAFVQERVVTRSDSPEIKELEDLAGREIVIRRSSSYWETLDSLRLSHPGLEVVAASEDLDTEAILYGVANGEYDATVADDILVRDAQGYIENLRMGAPLSDERPIAWAVRPESRELLAALDSLILVVNPAAERSDRRFGDLPAIEERRILRVLTRNNAYSYFVWRGQVVGFEYDLAREFAKRLGVHVRFVVVPTRAGLLTWLRQGRGDLVAAAITPTESRAERGVVFSRPYNFVSEVVVTRSDDVDLSSPADLAGRSVAVRRSSAYWETAEELRRAGIDFELVTAPEELETSAIIDAVARQEYDLTIADSNILEVELSWRSDVRAAFALRDSIPHVWVVRESDEQLAVAIDAFFNDIYRGVFYNVTRRKYFSNPARVEAHATRRSARTGALSPYDELFQRFATQYSFDWRLIAAQSYQESRFDPEVVSFAGAVGLMQVLPRTGHEFGFDSLNVPEHGIHAGVAYLRYLYDRFGDELGPERLWFALASYNAGYGHISDGRKLAARMNLDPNSWFGGVADVLPLLSNEKYHRSARHGFCRCREPVRYVLGIRNLYEAYTEAVPADQ